MELNTELKTYENDMKNAIDFLQKTLSEIRAGRANPAILNRVMVNYYGVPTPVDQVAGVSVPEAKMILIQPWDITLLKEIERAIIEANVGITPQNDGKVIRLVYPDLTEERRKELLKEIKEITENSKITIRNVRRDAIDFYRKQEKESIITEDDLRLAEEEVQKLTDKYVGIIDSEFDKKEKEIMVI